MTSKRWKWDWSRPALIRFPESVFTARRGSEAQRSSLYPPASCSLLHVILPLPAVLLHVHTGLELQLRRQGPWMHRGPLMDLLQGS